MIPVRQKMSQIRVHSIAQMKHTIQGSIAGLNRTIRIERLGLEAFLPMPYKVLKDLRFVWNTAWYPSKGVNEMGSTIRTVRT